MDQSAPIAERIRLLSLLRDDPQLEKLAMVLCRTLVQGKKILVFGNGGSATQASHFAAELVNKFRQRRPALAAIALTTDTAILTSIANDDDFRFVFSRQIEALGQRGDLACGLSTSGRSPNVLEALKVAGKLGLTTVAFCGRSGMEAMAPVADLVLAIDSDDTPAIQEMHLYVLHRLAGQIEDEKLGG